MSETGGDSDEIGARVRTEIDRAILRNIKGLEFLAAPKQAVGAMAKDTLIRRGTLQFYRYRPIVDEVYRVPIVIVTPTSNRGYIFDLAKGQSFVEFMMLRGYDVFMIDWLPPRQDESRLTLEDYVLDFIPTCIARAQQETGQKDISLTGYCMGGTLSLLYTALLPEAVKNLVLFATPLNFDHMALFRAWASEKHFEVDRLVDAVGNIPGEFVLSAFHMTRPANRPAGMLNTWANMWDDDYVKSYRMFDRWAEETLPLAGECFRQVVKSFLWRNAILKGEMQLGGRLVDLSHITAPLLSIVAQHDHIVPHPAAHPIMEKVSSSDREEIIVRGGHVSIVAGLGAVKRLWPSVDKWLGKRSV